MAEDEGVGTGIDREQVLVVANREGALGGVEGELQFPVFQNRPVVVAEEGEQHLVLQRRVHRVPVDVEVPRERRRLTMLQHIEPPPVVVAAHRHVVRHDVDDQAHAVPVERGDKGLELASAAELRVERPMLDDVVAVPTLRACLEQRRDIAVAYAERGEVGNYRGGGRKAEVAIQLQAVEGTRSHGSPAGPRCQATYQGGSAPPALWVA